MRRLLKLAVAAASLAFVSTAGIALATIPDASGVFHACVDNKTGAVRIIDSATSTCTGKETATSWSMIGPMGPQGPQGPPGPAGGLRFVDANGQLVGALINATIALRFINGDPVFLGVDVNGLKSGGAYRVQFQYESADCSGLALGGSGGLVADGVAIAGSIYYVAPGVGQPATLQSYASVLADGSMGPCGQFGPSLQPNAGPYVILPSPILVPPIRVTQ